jgi:transposase-like protein
MQQGRTASEKRSSIARMLDRGLSQAEVARRLGLSKATVSYHARRLGLPARDECARRYDWSEVQRAVDDEGLSMRQCQVRFGFCGATWSDAVRRGVLTPRPRKMPIDELLVVGRKETNRSHLKSRLIDEGLKANRCEICGIAEWRGMPLSMELHHLNGNGEDNRLENLQLLCGNCHSQTDNWGGRGSALQAAIA